MPLACLGAVVPVPADGGYTGGFFTCESDIKEASWISVAQTRKNIVGQPHSAVACITTGNSVIVLHLVGEDVHVAADCTGTDGAGSAAAVSGVVEGGDSRVDQSSVPDSLGTLARRGDTVKGREAAGANKE